MTNERTFRKQTFINDGRIFEKIVETKASIKRTQENTWHDPVSYSDLDFCYGILFYLVKKFTVILSNFFRSRT